MDEIGFRRAGAASREKILALYRRLEADERAPDGARMTSGTLRDWFGAYRGEALLAERGGETVGFALCLPGLPTPRYPTALYAAAEYVVPELRRTGLGRAFFGWFADRARAFGRDRLLFCCYEHNVAACDFVERLGATAEGRRVWTSPKTGEEARIRLYALPCGA